MEEMLGLLGDHPPCLLFELEWLPEVICIQLVDFKFNDLCQLAKWGNTLWSCWDIMSDVDAVWCRPLWQDKGLQPRLVLSPREPCATTIAGLEEQLSNAGNLAPARKTSRPAASSNSRQ